MPYEDKKEEKSETVELKYAKYMQEGKTAARHQN